MPDNITIIYYAQCLGQDLQIASILLHCHILLLILCKLHKVDILTLINTNDRKEMGDLLKYMLYMTARKYR